MEPLRATGGSTDSQGGYWPDAQAKAINIKLEQDSAGPTTCDRMEDLTFDKNFGKNMAHSRGARMHKQSRQSTRA
jgi:hypothetical protein